MKDSVPNDAKQIMTEVEQSLYSAEVAREENKRGSFLFNQNEENDSILSKIKQLYIKVIKLKYSEEQNRLTRREKEIIQLICNGNTTDEIAQTLYLSSHTVESHRSNIFSKMDVHNATELVAKAFRIGLVE